MEGGKQWARRIPAGGLKTSERHAGTGGAHGVCRLGSVLSTSCRRRAWSRAWTADCNASPAAAGWWSPSCRRCSGRGAPLCAFAHGAPWWWCTPSGSCRMGTAVKMAAPLTSPLGKKRKRFAVAASIQTSSSPFCQCVYTYKNSAISVSNQLSNHAASDATELPVAVQGSCSRHT